MQKNLPPNHNELIQIFVLILQEPRYWCVLVLCISFTSAPLFHFVGATELQPTGTCSALMVVLFPFPPITFQFVRHNPCLPPCVDQYE